MTIPLPTALRRDGEDRARQGSAVGTLLPIVSATLLVAVVVAIAWASNRGFDQTDEGYYLLSYRHPAQSGGVSQFARLVNALLPDASVQRYRVAGLVLQLVSSAMLALAFSVVRRRRLATLDRVMPPAPAIAVIVMLAGLQAYAWLPSTLSYNTINAALVNFEVAITLVAVTWRPGQRYGTATALCGVALGATLLVHLFVKSPAAVCVGLLCIVTIAALDGRVACATMLGGALAGATAMLLVTRQAGVFSVGELIEGSRSAGSSGHSMGALFTGYVHDLAPWSLFKPLVLIGLVAVVIGAAIGVRRYVDVALVAFGSVLVIAGLRRDTGVVSFAAEDLFPAFFAAIGVTWWTAGRRAQREVRVAGLRTVSALLLLAPVGGAVGTSNTLQVQCVTSAAPWGAAAVLLYSALFVDRPERSRRALAALPLLLVSVALAGQVVNGAILHPYRLAGSMFDQTEAVEGIPTLAGIRVDAATKSYLEGVVGAVHAHSTFAPGDPVVGVDRLPGLVLALDGYGPGANWVSEGDFGATCQAWRNHSEDVARTRLVLLRSTNPPTLRACLQEVWPAFPGRIEPVATVTDIEGYVVTVAVVTG